ncbi:MAG: thymidine phosphorylase [Clostridia bacterium]|nr:thymidine phosphorylase [Clostridia bacterium]
MNFDDILLKKRNGGTLTDSEIEFFIGELLAERIPDYKLSAFLMAIFFRGMTDRETAVLTAEMAHSGDCNDLSVFGDLTVDKHSTGGVGDKTTLIVAPIAAACGCKLAKMSGRALGITGGTVDKLEAIPGYRSTLSADDFIAQVQRIGIAVVGQSGELVPADKKLYALRDVTCTVDSIPLIASSIMSKKLAAGSRNIVLDVKCGNGAFMKSLASAKALAALMVEIGRQNGRRVTAVITDMSAPLGRAVGNALEVAEAVALLKGEINDSPLYEVCVVLASEMIALAGQMSVSAARAQVLNALQSGNAYKKFKEWIAAQGGDIACIDDTSALPLSPLAYEICADTDGYIAEIDAENTGILAKATGAGRVNKGDAVDPGAGLVLTHHCGEYVQKGEPMLRVYGSTPALPALAMRMPRDMIKITDKKIQPPPIILETIRQ